MTKRKDKEHKEALRLRHLGWSYSAIKKELKVSKSSLSVWLRDYPLSQDQVLCLQHSEKAKEKFRETMRRKREKRLSEIFKEEKERVCLLNNRELYIAGLMMYWGEGLKATQSTVGVTNTDPEVLVFSVTWLCECYGVNRHDLRIKLHMYSDMDREETSKYWSRLLGLPLSQFVKPYIKESLRGELTEKGLYGHGTCNLLVYDTRLKERIMMGIKAIKAQFCRSGGKIS